MDSLAALRDKPRDRRVLRRRLEQLDAALAHGKRRDAHFLVLDQFLGVGTAAEQVLENRHRRLEGLNCDADVVNFHGKTSRKHDSRVATVGLYQSWAVPRDGPTVNSNDELTVATKVPDNLLDHGVWIAPVLTHLFDVAVDGAVAQPFGYHLLEQGLAKQFEQPDSPLRLLPLDAQGARLAENAEPVERLAERGDAFPSRGH